MILLQKSLIMKSKIYLIPCPISENRTEVIPEYVRNIIYSLDSFLAERPKTTRKYLKDIEIPKPLADVSVEPIDKHDPDYTIEVFKNWIKAGKDIGIVSESGCPGIADPGADLVSIAHQLGVQVIPLVGPSSILMALMASGMNGQAFSFHGYLPRKNPALKNKLISIQKEIHTNQSAHLFIETPYRNEQIFKEIISVCDASISLCIAFDITGGLETIKTMTIKNWKKQGWKPKDKLPCMFVLGRSSY